MNRLWAPDFPFRPNAFRPFYGWYVVAISTLGLLFSIPGQTMGFSVFTGFLMAELGLGRVALSTAYCIGTVASGFTLPWLGRLFDRLGARRMIVFASIATGLILFYLSWTGPLLHILSKALPILRPQWIAFSLILVGFYLIRASAQGVLAMTSRNAVGKWFDYHRGTALALSGVFVSFGFSMAPPLLNSMIETHGAPATWRLLGVATIFGMALVGWLFLRDNPEECDLRMDGRSPGQAEREAHPDARISQELDRPAAVRTWSFWAFNLSFSFIALFSTAFTFHIVSVGAEAGRDKAEVLALFFPAAIISVCLNLLCGWLSPRIRLKWLLLILNLGSLLGVVGTIYLDQEWGKIAFLVGNGMAGGCFAALTGIVWPRFYGRTHLGAISGLSMASMVIASGIGPLLFSLCLDRTDSYQGILWACLLLPALLAVGSLWADNPQRPKA